MRSLIVFCHLRWDFVLQRPQHLMSRLARHYRVVFVEEPIQTAGEAFAEITRPLPNVEVLRCHTPHAGTGFADDQFPTMCKLLGDYLRHHDLNDYVVWFYTPMALPLLDGLAPQAVVYDCMDELSAFKNAPTALCSREADLLEVADVVFTGGPSLYEAKRDRHSNVLCLPSAVDAQHFARARALADTEGMRCADRMQMHVGDPKLGFFGVIDERLDLGLVDHVSLREPSWQLVMVGPVVKISPEDLPRRNNIHWLGQQSYSLLPHLVARWDVCLLPFALNESTRFISPTKTLEYMAAERPVVSTPVRDVADLYGRDVRIARDTEFVAACRAALEEPTHIRLERTAKMLETVAKYSWDNTADTIFMAIEATFASVPKKLLEAA